MKALGLEIAGKTDPGCVRENNEDCLVYDEELGLLVVADGMGGHNAGEVASDLAVSTIHDFARKMIGGATLQVPQGRPQLSPRGRQLEFFLESANVLIYEKGRAEARDHGMGTTVVAALVDAESLTVAHVGDSRLYLFRDGQLTQLTEDHSLVTDQVKRGLITIEEASRSNLQNILTRALGTEPTVMVDVSDHPLKPGDQVLLASDGLSKMVSDADAAAVMAQSQTAQQAVDVLVEKARKAGGVDNVTVIVARVPARKDDGALQKLVSKILG